jgi:hypothetical protein
MPEVSPAWWVAAFTTIGSMVIGYLTYRGSRAQAQPNAQEAINAGFTALADRQAVENKELRAELATVKRTAQAAEVAAEKADERAEHAERAIAKLGEHVRSTQQWHVRHVATFDKPMTELVKKVAPEEAKKLGKAEDFPKVPEDL